MKMPGNMQAMMQQAQKMQEKMQAEVALIRVEGTAGGGMVSIRMDGHKNVLGVKIDPEVAGDVEMLQDLVLAASNDAAKKVVAARHRAAACPIPREAPVTNAVFPFRSIPTMSGTSCRVIPAQSLLP